MQGNASEIDLSYMARSLKLRQENNIPTTLFLGAKAGRLFRNQAFYKTLTSFNPAEQAAFTMLSLEEQYQECFRILERSSFNPHDLHLVLLKSFQSLRIEASDLLLAELVKASYFQPLLTTNIDPMLERSLEAVQVSDFDIFQWQSQAGDAQHILFEARRKIIKIFGDFARRNYVLKERSKHIQHHPDLRQEIEIACKRHILMVGIDSVWDEHLLSYLAPQEGFSLWYVNDVPPSPGTPLSRWLDGKGAQFFVNNEGNYESFFKILHWRITDDVPAVYTVLTIADLHLLEVRLIEETLASLVNGQPLQASTLINFFGVHGIGKTSLLQQMKHMGEKKGIACALVDASLPMKGIWQDLFSQLCEFQNVPLVFDPPESQLFTLTMRALKAYLIEKPLVILLDSVDIRDTAQVAQIERLLDELLGSTNISIVIASKQKISFSNKPVLTRNVKHRQLNSFDRASSEIYLSRIGSDLSEVDRQLILELAHGYPLAIAVMAQTILGDRLDLQKPEDLARLFSKLMYLVVDKKILANVESEDLDWCRAVISLLSLPRRFTMALLQELLETFESTLAFQNPLENWGRLLNQIPRKTGIMDWDDKRGGFAVAEPVRNLFFQRLRFEQPERFQAVNLYLIEHNRNNARKGDMKCWREYLYHCTFSMQHHELAAIILNMSEDIRHVSLDEHLQLSEEVARDGELKEVLGDHFEFLTSLINQGFHTGD